LHHLNPRHKCVRLSAATDLRALTGWAGAAAAGALAWTGAHVILAESNNLIVTGLSRVAYA
jgi:hypothetical protein